MQNIQMKLIIQLVDEYDCSYQSHHLITTLPSLISGVVL